MSIDFQNLIKNSEFSDSPSHNKLLELDEGAAGRRFWWPPLSQIQWTLQQKVKISCQSKKAVFPLFLTSSGLNVQRPVCLKTSRFWLTSKKVKLRNELKLLKGWTTFTHKGPNLGSKWNPVGTCFWIRVLKKFGKTYK